MKFVIWPIMAALAAMVFYQSYVHRNDPPPPPPVPELVTTAADGTKLYHLYTGGHDVYFSKSGTTHEETHIVGKIVHHETITTPNAQP